MSSKNNMAFLSSPCNGDSDGEIEISQNSVISEPNV